MNHRCRRYDPLALYTRVTALTSEQRELLGAMTVLLVDIIENPHLPAMLVRMHPSPPESPTAIISAVCLSHDADAGAAMLREFSAQRALMEAAVMAEAHNNPSH